MSKVLSLRTVADNAGEVLLAAAYAIRFGLTTSQGGCMEDGKTPGRHPAEQRSHHPPRDSGDGRSAAAIGGLALVMLVCCAAGPLLVGAGALAALGTALRNPALIAAAALAALAAIGVAVYRHRARSSGPPPRSDIAGGQRTSAEAHEQADSQ